MSSYGRGAGVVCPNSKICLLARIGSITQLIVVNLVMVMAGPLLILLCLLFIRATVAISPRINAVLVVKIKM